MKKSARKTVTKKLSKKAPARPKLARRRVVARPEPKPASGVVPLRTTARIFAQNQADMLGVTLNKPALRKATERVLKAFKTKGIGGASIVDKLQTARAEGTIPEPSPIVDRANTPAALDPNPSPFPPRGNAIGAGVGPRLGQASVTSAPGNAPTKEAKERRPLDAALSTLDNALAYLYQRTGGLIARLAPVLPANFEMAGDAPPSGASENGAAVSNKIHSVAASIEGLASLLSRVQDELAV